MFLKRKYLFHKISLICCLSFICYAFYWWFFVRIPHGWNIYYNQKGYRYSFMYPENWHITECGNGEVVVGKELVQKCQFPLDAQQKYFDNLYFQVFLPKRYDLSTQIVDYRSPDQLREWVLVTWVVDEEKAFLGFNHPHDKTRIWSSHIPGSILSSPDSQNRFSVGFLSSTPNIEDVKKAVRSIQFEDTNGSNILPK